MTDKPVTLAGSLTSLVWGLTARPTTLPAPVAPVVEAHTHGPVRPQSSIEPVQDVLSADVVEEFASESSEGETSEIVATDVREPRKPRWSRARRKAAAAEAAAFDAAHADLDEPDWAAEDTFDLEAGIQPEIESLTAAQLDAAEPVDAPVQYLSRAERRRAERIGRLAAQAVAAQAATAHDEDAYGAPDIDETADDTNIADVADAPEPSAEADETTSDIVAQDEGAHDVEATELGAETPELAHPTLEVSDQQDHSAESTDQDGPAAEPSESDTEADDQYETSLEGLNQVEFSAETIEEDETVTEQLTDGDLFDVDDAPTLTRRERRRAERRERAESRRASKIARAEASTVTELAGEYAIEPSADLDLPIDVAELTDEPAIESEPEATTSDLAPSSPARETRAERRARIAEEKAARKAAKNAPAAAAAFDETFDYRPFNDELNIPDFATEIGFPSDFTFEGAAPEAHLVAFPEPANHTTEDHVDVTEESVVVESETQPETVSIDEQPEAAQEDTEATAELEAHGESEPVDTDTDAVAVDEAVISDEPVELEANVELDAAVDPEISDEQPEPDAVSTAVEDAAVTAAAVASATVAAAVVAAVQEALANQVQIQVPTSAPVTIVTPTEPANGPVRPAVPAEIDPAAQNPVVVAVPMPAPAAEQVTPFAVPGTVEMHATINEATITGAPMRPAVPSFKYDDYSPDSPTFLGQADPNAYQEPVQTPSRPVTASPDMTQPLDAPSGRTLRDRLGKRRGNEAAETFDQVSYPAHDSYPDSDVSGLPQDDYRDDTAVDLTSFDPSKYFGVHVDRVARAADSRSTPQPVGIADNAPQEEQVAEDPMFTPPVIRGGRDSREVLQMIRELSTLRNQGPQF